MKHIFHVTGRGLGLCAACLLLCVMTACTPGHGTNETSAETSAETPTATSAETSSAETEPGTVQDVDTEPATQSDGCIHVFGDPTVTLEPTCTEAGESRRTCTLCGAVEKTGIPAAGHTEVEDPAAAPTCTEDGKTAGSHCSVCGTVIKAQEIVYTFGHTPVPDAAVAPTCAAEGLTVGTHCSVCGEVITAQQPVEKLPHTPTYDNAVAPTCTETGLTDGTHCAVCGEVIKAQEVLPLKPHTVFVEAGIPATCTTSGTTDATRCAVCGIVLTEHEPIPPTDHTPGPASCTENRICVDCGAVLGEPLGHIPADCEALAPTCTEKGHTDGVICTRCGEVLSGCETIPAAGHRFAEDASCTESQVCLVCGELIESAGDHIIVIDPGTAPTCTEDGLSDGSHCAVCGKVLTEQEVLPAVGHEAVTDAAVEPTCQAEGLTEGSHCSRCGLVFEAQETIPAVDHKRKRELSKSPTCTEEGHAVGYVCEYCGVILSGCEVIPPLGHTPVVLDAIPPTCEKAGRTEQTVCEVCRLPLIWGEAVYPLGHKMVNVDRVEPTCTKHGYEAGRMCTTCGYEEVIRLIIPAVGHTPEELPAVAPTETEYGLTAGSRCAVCGEILVKQQRLPKVGGPDLHPGDADAFRGIVISKVYGTGKSNTDASASHGFVELFNSTDRDIPLGGLSLYLRKSPDGEFKEFTFPQDAVIPAGGYYLVRAKSPEGYDLAAAVITVEYFDAEWDTFIDNKECSLVLAPSGWTLFPGEDVTELTDAVSVFAASEIVRSDSVWFTKEMSKKKLLVRTAMTDYSGYYDVNLLKANSAKLQSVSPRTSDGQVNPVRSTLTEVYFSRPAGLYEEAFDLTLTAPEGYVIKYTTDGTDPRTSSTAKEYTGPLTLADSTAMPWGAATTAFQYICKPRDEKMPGGYVIKAYAADGTSETAVYTNTYFVTPVFAGLNVPVVSISMPTADFMSFYRYYNNLTVEDKRPRGLGLMEIFDEAGTRVGYSAVELAVNGNLSVGNPQKSMRVYYKGANNTEGGLESDLYYDLFNGRALDANGLAITDFSRIILRNSGNDAMKSGIRDAFMQRMSAGMSVDTLASATVVVFVNGELWGVYNARERYSGEYIESHYGVDKDNTAILEIDFHQNSPEPATFVLSSGVVGDPDDFNRLLDFITTQDMTDDTLLRYVEAHLDTDSLVDMFASRIFFNAKDWPENNVRVWRNRNPDDPSGMDTKWHFVLVDLDWGMSYLSTSTENSSYFWQAMNTKCKISDVFRALMQNEGFRERVLVRFYRVFTEVYDTDRMLAELQAMYDERKPLVELNAIRWPVYLKSEFTAEYWETEMKLLFTFVKDRQHLCLEQFYQYFKLNDNIMQEMIARVEGNPA